jgi:predicted helicase
MDCIIDDISAVLATVNVSVILNEYYQHHKGDDPIVHFYETFLSEYDSVIREKYGVYYTPEPVVSFIVRSLNLILKERFGKTLGLANGDVKILDPAAGTLTFIVEAAKLALIEYRRKWGEGLIKNFIDDHLLENFYAFEYMMAPYAIGHLKMSYVLEKMGAKLKDDNRFKLYLTNTLEMKELEKISIPGLSMLSEESRFAVKIKNETPILVILGNPPYSGHSPNVGEWISREIKEYYKVDGKPLGERNLKWIKNDYVKFIRFAQWKIDQNGEGILGFITSHSYLDSPIFRGMRQSLMKSFNQIYILDLHGNARKKEKCPDGSMDENVFSKIKEGVSIAVFVKKRKTDEPCKVYHSELWGLRDKKYQILSENDINSINWKEISPESKFYFFIPHDLKPKEIYRKFLKITDIFPVHSVGIVTARDKLTIHWKEEEVFRLINNFSKMKVDEARTIYKLGSDSDDWKVELAQSDLKSSGLRRDKIVPILYRPFDIRYTYYTGHSGGFHCRPRGKVMNNMLNENLGLIFHKRQELKIPYSHVFFSSFMVEHSAVSIKTTCYLSPLYIYSGIGKKNLFSEVDRQKYFPNIDQKIYNLICDKLGNQHISPKQILFYIYAVLYSESYRGKYEEFLRADFPQIPFTSDILLFEELSDLGRILADIHLMKSPELEQTFSKYEVAGDNKVKRVKYVAKEKRVYLNNTQYFSNIDEEIWDYYIGGYQVMHKWLKDRKGRTLSKEEIQHYIKVARALQLTIDYQDKIDDIYHGVESNLI